METCLIDSQLLFKIRIPPAGMLIGTLEVGVLQNPENVALQSAIPPLKENLCNQTGNRCSTVMTTELDWGVNYKDNDWMEIKPFYIALKWSDIKMWKMKAHLGMIAGYKELARRNLLSHLVWKFSALVSVYRKADGKKYLSLTFLMETAI